MSIRKWVVVAAAGSLGISGCSGNDRQAQEADHPQSDTVIEHGTRSELQPFSETVVRLQADGTNKIETFYRSSSEVHEASAAISVPTGDEEVGRAASPSMSPLFRPTCFGADVILWDREQFAGNSICFFARHNVLLVAHLTDYRRVDDKTWADAVGSYVLKPEIPVASKALRFYYNWIDAYEVLPVADGGGARDGGSELVPGHIDEDSPCPPVFVTASAPVAGLCVNLSVALTINR